MGDIEGGQVPPGGANPSPSPSNSSRSSWVDAMLHRQRTPTPGAGSGFSAVPEDRWAGNIKACPHC